MKTTILAGLLMLPGFAAAAPQVGKPAPTFTLPGHDGKTYDLAKLKGKYVVLEWFNNDCPYVEKHYHEDKRNMQGLQKAWLDRAKQEKKEVVWFAVASSAPGKQGHLTAESATQIRDQERKAHMTSILLDPEGEVGQMYDAKTTPHMFIIDPEGVLRYDGAIDDQPSARLASLNGAKNYVETAMTSLLAGKPVATTKTTPYGCSVKYK